MKKVLYLPIEVKKREYHAKLLLALYALERGYQVVIGPKASIYSNIKNFSPGIIIGTGITSDIGARLLRAKAAGHIAVAFDEEGLVGDNQEVQMTAKIKDDILRRIDYFFTWGMYHDELVKQIAPELENYSAIGNMRFEILKQKYRSFFEKDVQAIAKRYGKYILINTNFGFVNSVISGEYILQLNESYFGDIDNESHSKEMIEYEKEVFESFRALVSSLAKNNITINFILRPHPSENIETWKKLLRAPNIIVENRGSVIPWIIASQAVIQKNCTTATEAVYLDRPVITYCVKHESRFSSIISDKIGCLCRTEEEVMKALENPEKLKEQLEKDKQLLSGYVSNMETSENVGTAVLDVLDRFDVPAHDKINLMFNGNRNLLKNIKKVIKKQRKTSNDVLYKQNKFPELTVNEIKRDIKHLAETIQQRYSSIAVSNIDENLYNLTIK